MDILEGHEIILGTYEQYIIGYQLELVDSTPTLVQSFTDHAHAGSIRSLAAGGKFLVSGGTDENCKIFNLRNRTEYGVLQHHEGSVTVLKFFDSKHLITGSDDNNICILKAGSWQVEKTLRKHQAGVIDISVHPSGKLAMSVGRDRKLITWNLIKGRSAYVTNIKENAEFVTWSPDGLYYAVGFYKRVDIYKVDTAAVEYTIGLEGRANGAAFLDDSHVAIAGEMPQVEIHDIANKELVHKFEAHDTRVRCLSVVTKEEGEQLLVTASNDGFVKVWNVKTFRDFELYVSVDSKCRVTSLVVHKVPEVKAQSKNVDMGQDVQEIVKEVKKKKKKIQFNEPTIEDKEPAEKKQRVIVMEDDESIEKKKKKGKKKKSKKFNKAIVAAI